MTAWINRRLGDLTDILSGFAFDSVAFGNSGDLPVVRIRDVLPGESATYYRGEFDQRFIVRNGDVLIGMDGEFNRARWRGGDALLNQRVCRIASSSNELDDHFLFHFLPAALKAIESVTPFVTVKHLSVKQIRDITIPLPPLPEQRRIAEILDKADALRAKRRAALAQLDTITQSIFLDMFGDSATNPKKWHVGKLGDIATFIGGGTPSRARPEFFEGKICWATSKDMKGEFLDGTEEHITADAIEQSATNLVPAGTILIVVKSKILAHSLPVAIARVPTCFGQDLKGIKLAKGHEIVFVTTALRAGRRWLLERARGINTEGLTLEHLKAFPLLLPPSNLQQEFSRRIASAQDLKTNQHSSLVVLRSLFDSLQHQAFRGEL